METMIGFIVLFFLAVALSHMNHCDFKWSSKTRVIVLSAANVAGLISLFFAFSQLGKCVEALGNNDHATIIEIALSAMLYYLMVIKA